VKNGHTELNQLGAGHCDSQVAGTNFTHFTVTMDQRLVFGTDIGDTVFTKYNHDAWDVMVLALRPRFASSLLYEHSQGSSNHSHFLHILGGDANNSGDYHTGASLCQSGKASAAVYCTTVGDTDTSYCASDNGVIFCVQQHGCA